MMTSSAIWASPCRLAATFALLACSINFQACVKRDVNSPPDPLIAKDTKSVVANLNQETLRMCERYEISRRGVESSSMRMRFTSPVGKEDRKGGWGNNHTHIIPK